MRPGSAFMIYQASARFNPSPERGAALCRPPRMRRARRAQGMFGPSVPLVSSPRPALSALFSSVSSVPTRPNAAAGRACSDKPGAARASRFGRPLREGAECQGGRSQHRLSLAQLSACPSAESRGVGLPVGPRGAGAIPPGSPESGTRAYDLPRPRLKRTPLGSLDAPALTGETAAFRRLTKLDF